MTKKNRFNTLFS